MKTARNLHILVLSVALLAAACTSGTSTETAAEPSTTTIARVTDQIETEPESSIETTTPDQETVPETTEPATDDPDPEDDCTNPAGQAFYVDVSLDDPDGGLNMRVGPSTDTDIVGVFPRSSEVITTGTCAEEGVWWEVTNSDGSLSGWVASRFLSDLLVFNPGLGNVINDPDNVGLTGETLDEVAAQIAETYGFDEDATIAMVDEPVGEDAIGGFVEYEMTGLKDDASNGYLVRIRFEFIKSEDAADIIGYKTIEVTNQAMCTRGVTEDGLCI